ncbi:glutathione peroxidase [Hymenobacter saemangeumensis]|uniref:Glutathione peroxidase n=1 Tax=Hymenobacter saemangeumensis TaxID=1084522 RepID=A0ABP8INX7_9BACT
MKKSFALLSLGAAAAVAVACSQNTANNQPMTDNTENAQTAATGSVHDFTVQSIDGKSVSLSQYKGKKLLIVNTASECGYTPQYKELEELYKKHGDKVTVLGFPANDFGAQEPGSNQDIATFCEKNYGVTFPLFSKITVKGDETAPLYKFLSDKSKNGSVGEAPNWNFCKYLVDEQGKVVKFYSSKVTPLSTELVGDIMK